jgi:hypothetical protein
MVRSLPAIVSDIKADQVLLDVHKFLVIHPPQVWKSRADDTPLRTIRTILHSLAKLKGIDVSIIVLLSYYIMKGSRVSICCDMNTMRVVERETNLRGTRGA